MNHKIAKGRKPFRIPAKRNLSRQQSHGVNCTIIHRPRANPNPTLSVHSPQAFPPRPFVKLSGLAKGLRAFQPQHPPRCASSTHDFIRTEISVSVCLFPSWRLGRLNEIAVSMKSPTSAGESSMGASTGRQARLACARQHSNLSGDCPHMLQSSNRGTPRTWGQGTVGC